MARLEKVEGQLHETKLQCSCPSMSHMGSRALQESALASLDRLDGQLHRASGGRREKERNLHVFASNLKRNLSKTAPAQALC